MPPRPLAPSDAGPEGPPVEPPLGGDRGARFRRGNLLHRLLQHLSEVPVPEREAVAERLLRQASVGDAAARGELASEAIAVLHTPEFAALFGPGSRAEVPIAGLVGARRLDRQVGRVAADQGQDSAGAEHPRALRREQALAVEVTRLEPRRRRVGAVVDGLGGQHAAAHGSKTDAVVQGSLLIGGVRAAIAVGVPPADVAHVHARLAQLVADILADRIVHQRAEHGGAQSERIGGAARDVGLAAALGNAYVVAHARRGHVARVDAQHHLAKGDQVVAARRGGLDGVVRYGLWHLRSSCSVLGRAPAL